MAFLCIAALIIAIIHLGFFVTIKALFMLFLYPIVVMIATAFILTLYDLYKEKKNKK